MSTKDLMYNKNNPFLARIKERYSLSKPGSSKFTHHVILDIKSSQIEYQPGDSVAIFPTNCPDAVEKTAQALGYSLSEKIIDKTGREIDLNNALSYYFNISTVNRKLISTISERLPSGNKKEKLQQLLEDSHREALKAYLADRWLWDFLMEYSEVQFSTQELADLFMPLLPRFYSIASSQKAVGEEIHLTVGFVYYLANGFPRKGVCSEFLCRQAVINTTDIPLYLHPTKDFHLPIDPSVPIIMIGPGTGIAPYRAFMQERLAQHAKGKNWLFFGECNRSTDYFYESFWNELMLSDSLRIETAFSRDQENKVYVQHRMLEQGKDLFQWLENGAVLYVCGDAHNMAKDVDIALHSIIETHGGLSHQDAMTYVKQMRKDKRYLRDIY